MNDFQRHKEKKWLRQQLKENAWKLEELQPGADTVLSVYAYEPFVSGGQALAGLTADNIKNMSLVKEPMDIIAGSVGRLFERYLQATEKQRRIRTKELSIGLGIYMVNTASYKSLCTNNNPGHRHFVVLLYRNRFTGVTNLRPFSLISNQQILSLDEVKQFSDTVIKRDEAVNPGYFNFSPVVQL